MAFGASDRDRVGEPAFGGRSVLEGLAKTS
jgi:hypothetical protein